MTELAELAGFTEFTEFAEFTELLGLFKLPPALAGGSEANRLRALAPTNSEIRQTFSEHFCKILVINF